VRQLRKFFHLSAADRRLLIKSAFWLVAIRAGLRLLPFQRLRRLLARGRSAEVTAAATDRDEVKRVVWAIEATSRYVPSATCLTQGLAALILLNRSGQCAHIRIGVARGEGGQIKAHAWVESGGEVVLGQNGNLSRFRVLSSETKEIL
jgi:hypothetical protein